MPMRVVKEDRSVDTLNARSSLGYLGLSGEPMSKFLHAADLHLDSPLEGLDSHAEAPVERIRGATRRALENLVELALAERVRFVVIAGDVYDTNPMLASALFFRRAMQRLADASIPVVVALGNHDHAGVAPRTVRLPDGVSVLPHDRAASATPVPGVVVHGRSYPRRDCRDDLVEGYPDPRAGELNVGLLHTALTGDPQHDAYAPTTPAILAARGYQYWALGHIHRHARFDHAGVPIVFPGNLQGRHARETGPKGAVLVTYDGDRVGAIEHRALDVVRWHHVEVDAARSEGDLVDAVKQRVLAETAPDRDARRLSAVRVTVSGELAPGASAVGARQLREALLGELQETGDEVWLEKVRVEVRAPRGASSELDAQLDALGEALACDEGARHELARIVHEMRRKLRGVDAALDRHDERLATRAESLLGGDATMAADDARFLIRRALDALRAERG